MSASKADIIDRVFGLFEGILDDVVKRDPTTVDDNAPGLARRDAMDTSQDAAEGIEPVSGRLRSMVYATVHDCQHHDLHLDGATCDEVERFSGLSHQTCSARINELVRSGHLVDSGRRRKTRGGRNAAVWVVRT